MSAIENECLDGGVIVGMEDPLPEDPAVRYQVARQWVGCNRVFCRDCRAWVRHLDGVRIWGGHLAEAEIRELYADENAAARPYFTRGAAGELYRTYLCRCSIANVAGVKPLPYLDEVEGWYCAGHPR